MASGLTKIIPQLERQRAGIERALSALREVEGVAAPGGRGRVVADRESRRKTRPSKEGHIRRTSPVS